MTGFIQISDTHVVAPGQRVCGQSDTNAALKQAVAVLNAQLPALGSVACAVVTGDLTEHGLPAEYDHFSDIMAGLDLPWCAIPGNHDSRAGMRQAFADESWMPAAGPLHWVRDFGPFAVVGLDTLLEGAHYGHLCAAGFDFLDETLARLGTQPVLIATHHPWMRCGIPDMDADNLRNGDALMRRLERYPGPVSMISGHVHRTMTARIGKVTCQIAPSTGHAVHRDVRPEAPHALVLEPGAVMLHHWLEGGEPGLISDRIAIGNFPPPVPFG